MQQGQATAHARVHNIAASDDAYCGLVAWCGYDYPSGSGNQYQGVKTPGVIDLFRIPKPGAAIYKSQIDPKVRPVVRPAFYWDFGPTSPVSGLDSAMICANLDRLEILAGGAHYATATPDTASYGNLAYPPSFVDFTGVDGSTQPELRIDGYLGGTLVTSRTFSSDPSTDALHMRADDTRLAADGADATRVEFRAVDRFGAPRPYVDGQVTFSVRGPAILISDNPLAFGETGGAGAVWIRTLPRTPARSRSRPPTRRSDLPRSPSASCRRCPAAPSRWAGQWWRKFLRRRRRRRRDRRPRSQGQGVTDPRRRSRAG